MLPPSIFAEWGLIVANTRRGVFRVQILTVVRAFARRWVMPKSRVPKSGEIGMKEATKRAATEALAQMLAVTAMVVIASLVFYVR